MKAGLMQPYFLPYIGYFQLVKEVDKYIIYDDVNYIKNGWINRNNYLERDKARLFTLHLDGSSPNKKINNIFIKDNDHLKMRSKVLKSLKVNYSRASFYKETIELLEEIIMNSEPNIAKYNEFSIRRISEYLDIDTDILVSSDLETTEDFKGEERVIEICKKIGATIYINAIGGKSLYKSENFKKNNIILKFLRTNETFKYTQYSNEFIPNLSIIDVLMFNGFAGTKELLNQYTLEE